MLQFNDKAHVPYAHALKAWQPKVMGAKPVPEAFHVAALFVQRVGGVELLHIAMLQRPEGCTANQFLAAARLINPAAGRADNVMRRLAGIVNRADTGTGVFKLTQTGPVRQFTLSPRGKLAVKAALAMAAATVKAAAGDTAKAKAKKATSKARKASTAATPPVTPAPVTQATGDTAKAH